MQAFLEAIEAGASGDEIAEIALPDTYRAAHVLREEVDMFDGVASEDKDPRKSLHVSAVATPELAPRVGSVNVWSDDPEKAWYRWAREIIMLVDMASSLVMSWTIEPRKALTLRGL